MIDPQTLREVADWGDRTQGHYYWGYDDTSGKLRWLADQIDAGVTLDEIQDVPDSALG